MKKVICLSIMAMLLTGCLTPGRYRGALLDLDSRKEAEIVAYIPEASIVYTGANVVDQPPSVNPSSTAQPRAFDWIALFGFMEIFQGRLRVLPFEIDIPADQ